MKNNITVYGAYWCPDCRRSKRFLSEHQIAYDWVDEVIAQKTSLYPAKSGSWHSFFHNRVYIGEYEFDGEIFRTIYPPLISTVLFEAVQKHLPQK